MQSLSRRAARINSGQQNPAPSSTKINRNTQAMGINFGSDRYRKGRFARAIFTIPLKGVRNYSLCNWINKLINTGKLKLA